MNPSNQNNKNNSIILSTTKRSTFPQYQESQILNRQLLQLLQTENQIKGPFTHQSQPQVFKSESINTIPKDIMDTMISNFKSYCPDYQGIMDYTNFRKMLGLLGRQDSFISRIFHLIDEDRDGFIDSDDYIRYMARTIFGTEDQKAYNAWRIIIGNKANKDQQQDVGLQLDDFTQLFHEIAQLWSTLTGEIIPLNKKYIEEIFNIFDLDQDHIITFLDYRIFYQQQPRLFGWFEYLNGLVVDQTQTQIQLNKLRQKLNQGNYLNNQITIEQIKDKMNHKKRYIQKGIKSLIIKLGEVSKTSKNHIEKINIIQKAEHEIEKKSTLINSNSITGLYSNNTSSHDISSLNDSYSIHTYQALKKLNRTHVNTGNSHLDLSRIQSRRNKLLTQGRTQVNTQLMKQFKKLLNQTEKLISGCQDYRQLRERSHQFSPIKLRQRKIKYTVVNDKNLQKKTQKDQKQKIPYNSQQPSLVYFGHPNWNLVLNLMVGLRKSIKALYQPNYHLDLTDSHFSDSFEFNLGSKVTNGYYFSEHYKLIEMAPLVFQRLRHSYGINNLQYQRSVGPETLLNHLLMGNVSAINEKCSTGKSGSFFYLTLDNRIYFKTIPKHQFIFFADILSNYYKHMIKYQNTLIVRVYGLYKLKIYKGKQKLSTIYFISMENVFAQAHRKQQGTGKLESIMKIKQFYDLKGSLYGRTGSQGKQLKDNDWVQKRRKLRITQKEKEIMKEQIKVDSKFFKNNNINDYSLLIAIVELNHSNIPSEADKDINNDKNKQKISNLFKQYYGGIKSLDQNIIYVISIIDILTVFETRKNFEYLFKTTFLSKDVSCIPPRQYCDRFRTFISNHVLDFT